MRCISCGSGLARTAGVLPACPRLLAIHAYSVGSVAEVDSG